MTDVLSVLQTALAECGPSFGVKIPELEGIDGLPCFFLQREYDIVNMLVEMGGNNSSIKSTTIKYKVFSHMKLYKGRCLDYVKCKEYDSLEEWASDNLSSIDDVLFGYQRFDGKKTFITLKQLMKYLCPSPEVADIEDMMRTMQVAPRRVIAKCGRLELSYDDT
jgi:hypothetical protein